MKIGHLNFIELSNIASTCKNRNGQSKIGSKLKKFKAFNQIGTFAVNSRSVLFAILIN